VLPGRVTGAALALYGLGAILFAARNLGHAPPPNLEFSVFAEIVRNLALVNLLFGAGLLALGVAIALRRSWTRGVDWMSCIVLVLLIPAGFSLLSALLGGGQPNLARSLATYALEAALLIAAAVLLHRNPPPDRVLAPGTRAVRPRVTFVSRALGVLLILAGLMRIWLSLLMAPEVEGQIFGGGYPPRSIFEPYIFSVPIWSFGLAMTTIVAGFAIGLKRPWGLQLGVPLSFAGFIVDARAAIRFPSDGGQGFLDWVILRDASALLFALTFVYCLVQLLRPPKTVPIPPPQKLHYPLKTKPAIADDPNWRTSLLASLKSAGTQPARGNAFTGVVLPLAGAFIIAIFWALLNAVIRLDSPAGSSGPNLAITVLLTVAISAFAILLVQRLIAFLARRFWRFRARSAEQELERNSARRPVLYLRSFALDEETARPSAGELLLGMMPTASAEQMLAKTLNRRKGPVIAIGLPGEKLPGLGAARFYADHDVWHQKVADAAHVAQLIIWTTGTTEGLRWEISHLLKSVPPAKLIVWAHPQLLRAGKAEREHEWSEFLAKLGDVFPKKLPERLGKTRFIWFKDDWEPVPVAPRWGWFGILLRPLRDAQTVALKQLLGQKAAYKPA
jgi:hypothetical protein